MLSILSDSRSRDCAGMLRRDFLKVGALGAGALTLPGLLAARAEAKAQGKPVKDTAIVWVWLAGGPTQMETFDPHMNAPVEYRSTTGHVRTKLPGVTIGGTFPKIARVADKMAFVRSFAHNNSGHVGGTHFVNTGYDNRNIDNGGAPARPALGAIVSRVRGTNHRVTGMPTYVALNRLRSGIDGPAFLGTSYGPFDPKGQALKNLSLAVPEKRVGDRRFLLASLDRLKREADATGAMTGMDRFEQQAFDLVLGGAPAAFNIKQESSKTRARYGKGIGEQLLQARRLCEAGCGFVTLSYNGWDMHNGIEKRMKQRSPSLDQAIAAFVDDIHQRGLSDRIMLVITGEFGRTPKVNGKGGRDHWAPLSTLAVSGGGLKTGQVVGESMPKGDVPKSVPIRPQDLMATVFDVLGIDRQTQFISNAGRPVYMIEDGEPIAELL
ncbi:MAG: DUF1501 domain-containing protein [Planctomycetota bacterium]|nr:MAG: DUF1501 domain-containing protein [Planctomycetota bacterium]